MAVNLKPKPRVHGRVRSSTRGLVAAHFEGVAQVAGCRVLEGLGLRSDRLVLPVVFLKAGEHARTLFGHLSFRLLGHGGPPQVQ